MVDVIAYRVVDIELDLSFDIVDFRMSAFEVLMDDLEGLQPGLDKKISATNESTCSCPYVLSSHHILTQALILTEAGIL